MANNFYNDNPEEIKAYKKMIISCVVAASLIILLFLIVLYQNSKEKKRKEKINEDNNIVNTVEDDFVYGESNLKSEDLDFWKLYSNDEVNDDDIDEDEEDGELTPYKKKNSEENQNDKDEINSKKDSDSEDSGETEEVETNRIKIVNNKGETVWYDILSNVKKNQYDLKKNLSVGEKDRLYYQNNDKKSFTGIDISKNDNIEDFSKIKNDGIDFVMIRVGSRGYSSGIIQPDDNFLTNVSGFTSNGIYTGVFFESQAINETEAIEEANFSVGAVSSLGIRYPIAIYFRDDYSESTRCDKLTMKERTTIAKTFCDTVKQYGLNPVIRGSRDFLISKLNLEDLKGYDIWLDDECDETDYPYEFNIWQYKKAEVDGINGSVNLNICFVKYEEK